MKQSSQIPSIIRNAVTAAIVLLPSLAMAHPGHYHPGEEDEFDAMRANFLHLHGALEISIALTALAAVAVLKFNKNQSARITAALALGGSLAFIAAH